MLIAITILLLFIVPGMLWGIGRLIMVAMNRPPRFIGRRDDRDTGAKRTRDKTA